MRSLLITHDLPIFINFYLAQGTEVGTKILADVVESYVAALLLDMGLDYCQKFLQVCLFPKLTVGNDPKSVCTIKT